MPKKSTPASPPNHDRVINVNSRGLEISGVTYSAAKKNTQNAKNHQGNNIAKREAAPTCTLTFTPARGGGVIVPHPDALVISLMIANYLMKKILVNNESSTNILFM